METNVPNNRWLRGALSVAIPSIFGLISILLIGKGFNIHLLLGASLLLLLIIGIALGKKAATTYKSIAVIILNTFLLLAFIEVTASAILWSRNRVEAAHERAKQTYYSRQTWGPEYLEEGNITVTYEPFVVWKGRPARGKYINIDEDGNRFTPGAKCEKDSFDVWVFGGSTVWGDGVPDWGTVPAYLQQYLSETRKESVCVRNFGQLGWVSTQSVIELLRHLQQSQVPKLVIFYDGANDVSTASEGVAGVHDGVPLIRSRLDPPKSSRLVAELLEQTNAFKLLKLLTSPSSEPDSKAGAKIDPKLVGRAVSRVYLTNYLIVGALAKNFRFDYAFFWQPSLSSGKKPLTAEEKEIGAPSPDDIMRTVYLEVQTYTQEYDRLFDIADIFDNTREQMYLDEVHLTPEGNEAVAKRILERLTTMNRASPVKPNGVKR